MGREEDRIRGTDRGTGKGRKIETERTHSDALCTRSKAGPLDLVHS